MQYTLIDLNQIRQELGQHWNPQEKDEYKGKCGGCGNKVTQSQIVCCVCDRPVVWRGSRVWSRDGRQPGVWEKRWARTPETDDTWGWWLCQEAGVERFPDANLLSRWKAATDASSRDEIMKVVRSCSDTLVARRQPLNRGLIRFAVRTLEKKVRERAGVPQRNSEDDEDWRL